jgi:hypothetical protein
MRVSLFSINQLFFINLRLFTSISGTLLQSHNALPTSEGSYVANPELYEFWIWRFF